MNKYMQWLDLDFDPFVPSSSSRDFYCSGDRQTLLDQIVEFSLYSNAMIAVTGPLGAGKTTLAKNFCERFADEAVCVRVAATLFMNQGQFLDALQSSLSFKPAPGLDTEFAINQICQYAAELDLEARSLIIIIDDAHELSAEVLQLLTKLLDSCVDSSIHALLLGERQLDNLLQNTLTNEAQDRLAVFPLDGFASDETHDYIRFKLATAGFNKEMPLEGGVVGAIHNASQGMPGAINGLIANALNAAAPAVAVAPAPSIGAPAAVMDELDDIDEFGPLTSGERFAGIDDIEQFEGLHASERLESGDEDGAADMQLTWLAGVQPRYLSAAAILLVLLTGTLLFWDASPRVTESLPIPVAIAPAAIPPVQDEPELIPTSIAETPAAVAVVAAAAITETANAVSSAPVDAIIAEAVSVEENEPVQVAAQEAVANVVEQVAEVPVLEATPVLAEVSAFEGLLLQEAPESFAVQLSASRSEANISAFVGKLAGTQPVGYFETRHQGGPWFVAVLAPFSDRDQATRAISALPEKMRSNQPWIRSVAGIQTDIREQLSSKLLSAK
ncbi:MAG: AAA family ATPase [Pseudomonadales bacterium]|jgi:DamX protein|nr:AAA family ATPase [Pseudomonadales bacterium]